jgi:hypothetical protein
VFGYRNPTAFAGVLGALLAGNAYVPLNRTSALAEVESGPRRGMLVGHIMPVATGNRTKCLIVEDMLWGDLESLERDLLLKFF